MKRYFSRMKTKAKSPQRESIRKIIWSWIGAFLSIYCITVLGTYLEIGKVGLFLIGSFGASAVLVYGLPLAALSQPRNLVGGHFMSAFVGVTVFIVVGEHFALASALAVSLAIVVMQFTRTMHPPGGATALIAVIGGEKIHALGYMYLINPVLIGALIMLLVALVVNNLSTDTTRHYPIYWL